MNIRFSRHARRQMKWRRISEEDVFKVLDDPDQVEGSIRDRKNAYKSLEGRLLKVTYKEEDSETTIFTVIEKEKKGNSR